MRVAYPSGVPVERKPVATAAARRAIDTARRNFGGPAVVCQRPADHAG